MGAEQSSNKFDVNFNNKFEDDTKRRRFNSWPGKDKERKVKWNSGTAGTVGASSDRELTKWEEERKRLVNNCIFIDF